MAEVFKLTHTLKANKEQFADDRADGLMGLYNENFATATQQRQNEDEEDLGANMTVNPDKVWRQTVSELDLKNHIHGVGKFYASTLRTSSFKGSAVLATSPSSPAGSDEIDLRKKIHFLNQNFQDMGQQLQESEERNQAIIVELREKNAATEELRQRMTEELELSQNLRRQMAAYYEQMRVGGSSEAGPPPPGPRKGPQVDDGEDANDYEDP
ncbi:hypothetical protein PIB30_098545 [Stylosanthes scabra]|uniref:Uncharacterized protein n=1 Tax=Stylosanthes scabra TaxID=79078 RepID=A0ABU6WUU8_9FABA|nr:hypothetical protein [Stylosanthes scabra]